MTPGDETGVAKEIICWCHIFSWNYTEGHLINTKKKQTVCTSGITQNMLYAQNDY